MLRDDPVFLIFMLTENQVECYIYCQVLKNI